MKFFVSYRRTDPASRGLAAALLSQLSDRGHQVFVDEHGIAIGTPWQETIEAKIAACDAVVLLVCRGLRKSDYVQEELRAAKRHGKPVLPVLVSYLNPRPNDLGDEAAAVVARRQFGKWQSPANTPYLVDQLSAWTPDAALPPVEWAPRKQSWWRWGLAALLLVGAAAAAVYLVRASAARTLEKRAETLLASQQRDDIDRGLVLAALAASKRGRAPGQDAQTKYSAMHYDRLVTTLHSPVVVAGNSLAVSPDGDAIVVGNRVWRCAGPQPVWQCPRRAMTLLNGAGALTKSVFASPREIVTLDVNGLALRWGIEGDAHPVTGGARATTIAAANGEIAVAFAAPPSIKVYDTSLGIESSLKRTVAIRTLTFGPCPKCLTMLDADGDVYVWNREQGTVWRASQNARQVATTTHGRLVVIEDTGLFFFDARLASVAVHPQIDTEKVTSMDASEDGTRAVLVHDGRVTIVDDRGKEVRILSGNEQPAAVAAQFHRNVLVTRSPTEVRVWRPESFERKEGAPVDARLEWGKQLGLDVNDRGEIAERVFQPDQ